MYYGQTNIDLGVLGSEPIKSKQLRSISTPLCKTETQ